MEEKDSYKAGGLVPYCTINGEFHLQLGLEHRGRYEQFLGIAGGKRELADKSAYETAQREFCEETSFDMSDNLREKQAYRDDIAMIYIPECRYTLFFPYLGECEEQEIAHVCEICQNIDMESLTLLHDDMRTALISLQRPHYESYNQAYGHSMVNVLPSLSVSSHLLPKNWEAIMKLVTGKKKVQPVFPLLAAPPAYKPVRGEVLPVPRVVVPTCAHRPPMVESNSPAVECRQQCKTEYNIMNQDRFYPPLGLCQSAIGQNDSMGCPLYALELYEFDEAKIDRATLVYTLDFLKQMNFELKCTPEQRQEQLDFEWFTFLKKYYDPRNNGKKRGRTVQLDSYCKGLPVPPRSIDYLMSVFRVGQWMNRDAILAYARVLHTLQFDPDAPALLEVKKFVYDGVKPERETRLYSRTFSHDKMLHMLWVPLEGFALQSDMSLYRNYNQVINMLPKDNKKGKDRYGKIEYEPIQSTTHKYQPARTCRHASQMQHLIKQQFGLEEAPNVRVVVTEEVVENMKQISLKQEHDVVVGSTSSTSSTSNSTQ